MTGELQTGGLEHIRTDKNKVNMKTVMNRNSYESPVAEIMPSELECVLCTSPGATTEGFVEEDLLINLN